MSDQAVLTWFVAFLCVLFTVAYHLGPRYPGTAFAAVAAYLVLPPAAIWEGRYSSLFTDVFVHAGAWSGIPWHLLFNLLYLVMLGRILEETIHPALWMLFFVASGVASSGAELAFSGHNAIGVSGVIYAMFGLMWAGRYENRTWAQIATPKTFRILIAWGILCVIISYFGILNIANYSHAGGLLFGLAVGWLFVAKRRIALAVLILASVWIVMLLSISWLPWSPAWLLWRGDVALRNRDFATALRSYERSLERGADPLMVQGRIWTVATLMRDRAAANGAIEAIKKARIKQQEEADQRMKLPWPFNLRRN
jgi:GlpG protein